MAQIARIMKRKSKHGFCKSRIKWRLKNSLPPEGLSDFLELASISVDAQTVAGWTPLQRAQAEEWAQQVHLAASDNSHVRIPPKPNFLPKESSSFLDLMTGVKKSKARATQPGQ